MTEFLGSVCRICMNKHGQMHSVEDYLEDQEENIITLLQQYVKLNISADDGFSKVLCNACTCELEMVVRFIKKCKLSEQTFSELFEEYLKNGNMQAEIKDDSDEKHANSDSQFEDIEYLTIDDEDELNTEIELNNVEVEKNEIILRDSNQIKKRKSNLHKVTPNSKTVITSNSKSTDSKLSCIWCGAGFKQEFNLDRHLKSHDSVEAFVCKQCDLVFPLSDALNYEQHLFDHGDIPDGNCKEPVLVFPANLNMKINTGSSLSQLNDNITKIRNDQFSTFSAPPSKVIKKKFECDLCYQRFPSNTALDTHIRTHTGERPFECSICQKKFTTSAAMESHKKRHIGEKNCTCTECGKKFYDMSNLRVHYRTHTGEKPHKCIRCGRSFSRVYLLQLHFRTHTREKPYICDVCNKGFAQQGDLSAHIRIHTGERPHKCVICGKGFIKSSALTIHLRRHEKKKSIGHGSNLTDTD